MPTGELLQALSATLAVTCLLLVWLQRRTDRRAKARLRVLVQELEEGRTSFRDLQFRADAQRVLMEASARFLRAGHGDVDRCVQTTLKELGEFLAVKRALVYRFRGDGEGGGVSHRWNQGGNLRSVEVEAFLPTPQLEATMREGRTMRVGSVGQLPEEAVELRAYLAKRNSRALLAVPLLGRGESRTLGFLMVESTSSERAWSDDEAELAAAVAELLALELVYRDTASLADTRRHQLDAVMNAAPLAMITLDRDGKVLFAEGSALRESGGALGEFVGRSAFELGEDSPAALDVLRRGLAGEEFREELRIGGRVLEVHARPMDDGAVGEARLLLLATDVTARVRAEEEVVRGRLHDDATGLPNRAFLVERLREALHGERPGALLLLSLDRWGPLQDALGPDAAERYLAAVARSVEEGAGDAPAVARIEPEVFAVLVDDDDPETVRRIGDRAARTARQGIELDGRVQVTGVSIGSARGDEGERDPHEWIRRAHTALLAARQRGGDCTERWVPAMHTRVQATWRLEEELAEAIRDDVLEAWLQPIVDLETGRPVAFEALARWPHPREGMMPPGRFIPLAEENGMISAIGWNMLAKACAELNYAVAGSEEWDDLYVSVNVSSRQLTDPDFLARVSQVLDEHALEPTNLQLEITESDAVGPGEDIIPLLDSVRATGIRISLDDFGTGYSSLSYLNRLPADSMKVDRSFVVHMGSAASGRKVITSILLLAQGLSLTAIAEGIETEAQRIELQALGCQYGQGFLFSKALAPGEARAWLDGLQRAGAGAGSGSSSK